METRLLKFCLRCGFTRPLDFFKKNTASPDGKHSYCRACTCKIAESYRINNKEKIAASRAKHYAANKEKIYAYQKTWNKANPQKIRRNVQKSTARLADSYVRHIIRLATPFPLPHVPTELVKAKRAHLLVRRLIKEKQK